MVVSISRGKESELWNPVDFQDALSHIEIRLWFVYMLSSVAVHDIEICENLRLLSLAY